MIICLDGIDYFGKSSLVTKISERLSQLYPNDEIIIRELAQSTETSYEEYSEFLMEYVPNSGVHYILDGWHIKNLVYGPLYYGKTSFDKVSYRWTELFLASLGVRLWNVTQQGSIIEGNLRKQKNNVLQSKHIDQVARAYQNKASNSILFSNHISPTQENIDYLTNHIITDASYAENKAADIKNLGVNYLGRVFVAPKTVLVVENKKINRYFDPKINEEANILLSTLHDEFWRTFSVVSSSSLDRLEYFLNEYLWSTNVIAYGDTVKARLKLKNIPFGDIEKPSLEDSYTYKISAIANNSGKL